MGKTKDDNDRKREGTLPHNPRADTVPMTSATPPVPCPRIGTLAKEAFATMVRRQKREETPLALPWPTLNKVFEGGLWPGLHVLVSSTGSGKTQFAIQMAIHTAQAGRPVVYAGLELGASDVVARTMACLASLDGNHVKWSDVLCGRTDERKLTDLIHRYEGVIAEMPLHVEIAPAKGWSTKNIDRIAAAHPGALVILDYLQLVKSEGRDDQRKTIGDAAYALRMAARDKKCTVLAISSTSRAAYGVANGTGAPGAPTPGEGDPAAFVGMGKESGDIEYACDTVLFLAAEKYQTGVSSRKVHVAVAKHRVGPPAWCELRMIDGSRFEDEAVAIHRQAPGVGKRP